ncbi:MAG: hypothetical protein JWL59_89 [Chthoniobacteraceae bacterium]|nr:hypothetical protein [Chthoniobacteraceae bacterium]
MSNETTETGDREIASEDQIRRLIKEWQSALCDKDLQRLTANYSSDIVFFDVVPPFQTTGVEGYREKFGGFFPYLPARIETEQRDLKIKVSGDLAFAHCLTRIVNAETREAATCGWVRATVCYQRQEGQWRVVHEHVSVPFDPVSGRAVLKQGFEKDA